MTEDGSGLDGSPLPAGIGGVHEDGVVGPRTVIALSRVAGGRASPSIAEESQR
jgi:hypothetical protein